MTTGFAVGKSPTLVPAGRQKDAGDAARVKIGNLATISAGETHEITPDRKSVEAHRIKSMIESRMTAIFSR